MRYASVSSIYLFNSMFLFYHNIDIMSSVFWKKLQVFIFAQIITFCSLAFVHFDNKCWVLHFEKTVKRKQTACDARVFWQIPLFRGKKRQSEEKVLGVPLSDCRDQSKALQSKKATRRVVVFYRNKTRSEMALTRFVSRVII